MLIQPSYLKTLYPKFKDIDNELLLRKLSVIESAIRKHTNNKFQNTFIRLNAPIVNGVIQGTNSNLAIGDTIEISNGINKGLYTIGSVSNTIVTNEPVKDSEDNLITKIEYPIDVVEGAIDLLDWELLQNGKENTGVASESISRHNVSYVQRNGDNMVSGYPIELFNFCDDYMKARF